MNNPLPWRSRSRPAKSGSECSSPGITGPRRATDRQRRRIAAAVVAVFCAAPPLDAQQPAVWGGPVLYFYANGADGRERTYVVDALAETPAVPIGLGRIGVRGRLRDGRLICRDGWPETCLVTMRPDGTDRRVLVAGGHDSVQPDFVDMQHDRIYVRFESWDGRPGSLRVFEDGGPAHGTELLDQVGAVLATSLDGMFVVRAQGGTAQTPAGHAPRGDELWFVPRQPGGARRVTDRPLDLGPGGLLPNVALSPNGRRLALGIQHLDGTGGQVLVVDVVTGAVAAAIEGIDVSVSRLSSNLPEVVLAWRDEHVLRYSRTTAKRDFEWVDYDVRKGKEIGIETYGSQRLAHRQPPGHRERAREATAKVRVDERGVYYVSGGDASQVASEVVVATPEDGWSHGFSGTLQRSPDGRAAACLVDGRVLVVDGVHRRVRIVFEGRWQFPNWAPVSLTAR